jgi:hypothetical protein
MVMKHYAAVLLGGALLAGVVSGTTPRLAAATETLAGEVVSLSCYMNDKTKIGRKGYVCALATVKWEGNPAGLLTADGKLYQIAGKLTAKNNEKLWPVLSHTVTITGDVSVKEGMPTITADEVTDVAPPK